MFKKIRQELRFRAWRLLMYQARQEVKSGNWRSCEAKLSHALGVAQDLVKDAGADTTTKAELCLATTLGELGAAADYNGDKLRGEMFSKQASDLKTKHATSSTNEEIGALIAKGRLLQKEQKMNEAVLFYSQAKELSESKYGDYDERIIPSLDALASGMFSIKNYDECERLRRRILELCEQCSKPNDISIAMALFSLSLVMRLKKNLEESEQLLIRALAILDSSEPSLGDGMKELFSAKGNLQKIEKLQDQTHGIQNPLGVLVLRSLALTNADQGKNPEAEYNFRRAIGISEARNPLIASELRGLLEKYAKFMRKAGRVEEAAATEERARKLAQ